MIAVSLFPTILGAVSICIYVLLFLLQRNICLGLKNDVLSVSIAVGLQILWKLCSLRHLSGVNSLHTSSDCTLLLGEERILNICFSSVVAMTALFSAHRPRREAGHWLVSDRDLTLHVGQVNCQAHGPHSTPE